MNIKLQKKIIVGITILLSISTVSVYAEELVSTPGGYIISGATITSGGQEGTSSSGYRTFTTFGLPYTEDRLSSANYKAGVGTEEVWEANVPLLSCFEAETDGDKFMYFDAEDNIASNISNTTIVDDGGNLVYRTVGHTSSQSTLTTGLLKVDTSKTYTISGLFKSVGVADSRTYYGFIPYKANKTQIYPVENNRNGDDGVILSWDSTTITLSSSVTGWQTDPGAAAHTRSLGFYFDGDTSHLPDRYITNNTVGAYSTVTGDTIYINAALPSDISSQIIPGTTIVKNHRSGGFIYAAASSAYTPHSWTKYEATNFTGEAFNAGSSSFWVGTEYVRLYILTNYTQTTSEETYIDDLLFTQTNKNVLCEGWEGGAQNCGEGGCYNKARFEIDPQNNPTDALYSIQIKPTSSSTWQYLDWATLTLENESTNDINDFRTKTEWETPTFNVTGLLPGVSYDIRATALQGDFTETGPGPSLTATTSIPSLVFDIDVAASDTETSPLYNVNLGQLSTASPTTATDLIWLDIGTNSDGGAQIFIEDDYAGLQIESSSYTINSATADLSSASEGFGLRSASASAQYSFLLQPVSPFNSTGQNVGGLTVSPIQIYNTNSNPILGGRASIEVKARVQSTTPAGNYSDQITFTVLGSF